VVALLPLGLHDRLQRRCHRVRLIGQLDDRRWFHRLVGHELHLLVLPWVLCSLERYRSLPYCIDYGYEKQGFNRKELLYYSPLQPYLSWVLSGRRFSSLSLASRRGSSGTLLPLLPL